LFDSSEHAAAGGGVTLPGIGPGGTDASGTDEIFYLLDDEKIFSFGNLTYIAGDFIAPYAYSHIICTADNYEDRKERAKFMMNLFNDDYLAGKARKEKMATYILKEKEKADKENVLFQKHVVVHQNALGPLWKKIDELGIVNAFSCGSMALGASESLTAKQNVLCMSAVGVDHFGECAQKTHQIFHDLALEAANKGELKKAYFYEGIGSHSLTDLFSAGHVRNPYVRLSRNHCSGVTSANAINQMHDEDSYNGIYMTNRIKSDKWWVFGDSFYFEPFSEDNRKMILKALQGGINEVYAAYEARIPGSSDAIKGSSNGEMGVYPSRSLDFIPDLAVSQNEISEFWDVNTCPMWYENKEDGGMYRRLPWFRIRSEKGRSMGDSIPASNKFGLFNSVFPLVDDQNQLKLSGKIDLDINGCWFRFSPETSVYSDECMTFAGLGWQQSEMFYSPELGGFLPPDLATCQAYTKGGRNAFDNDCYDVLEAVSTGQNCADLTTSETCGMLTPRCTWSDGTCVQGSCVAYSHDAGDIVPGDPTPPVPVPPTGFYMSFQGSCAFDILDAKSYKKMPGKNDAKMCAKICQNYVGLEGECTGIAVDSGAFEECYLYFNNACQRADGPGFLRCASHGLQAFHKGLKSAEEIMSKCDCSASWYYKDKNVMYTGCQAVEAESWGSWCYLANPDECELGMYTTTQPDQKWRYCEESTCENFQCPTGFVRRDTVICYDDTCDVGECCGVDPNLKCEDQNSKLSCEAIACAWQDGYFTDACVEPICQNWYTEADCEGAGCAWNSVTLGSDYCSLNRRLEAGAIDKADEIDDIRRLETDKIDKDNWGDAIDNIAADEDIISNLVSPLSVDSQTMHGMLQPKLDAMMQALMTFDDYEDQLVVFSAFDDGRFYSLKSCDRGLSCWSKYPGAEYTFGVVDPNWNEFINVFKVVDGKVDASDNSVSEFGAPDYALEPFNLEDKAWYGKPGRTAPFTCLLMHPDTTEICEAYTKVGADFTLGIQIISSEDGENEDEGPTGPLTESAEDMRWVPSIWLISIMIVVVVGKSF
jgi:hypothetical protein